MQMSIVNYLLEQVKFGGAFQSFRMELYCTV